MFSVGAHVLLDLDDKLTRRRQHQRAQPVHVMFLVATVRSQLAVPSNGLSRFCELHQNRQNESSCLPRPGLGDADDIVSRENEWNGRNLDWSRLGVTRIPNRLQHLR